MPGYDALNDLLGAIDPAAYALVNADPLHNKEATVRVLLDQGGDSLIGTKANTSQRLAAARQALKGSPLLS